ncbi:TraB/GumN family protein [Parasulfitobacter algicola]|nr:TraB/GumN family protein [Sulfitobacter algicola]
MNEDMIEARTLVKRHAAIVFKIWWFILNMRYLILIGLLFPTTLCAQDWFTREACFVQTPVLDEQVYTPQLIAQAADYAESMPNSVGKLWKITSARGQVSHLWGTFHSNDPHILDLPDKFRDILAGAKLVATEVDFTAMTRQDLNVVNSAEYHYANGRQIFQMFEDIDDEIQSLIKTRMASIGYDARSMYSMKPATLASVLLSDPCNDFAFASLPIQDDRIALLGHDADAKVIGLEHHRAFGEKLNSRSGFRLAQAIIEVYGSYLAPNDVKTNRAGAYFLYDQGRIGEMMALDRMYLSESLGDRFETSYSLMQGYLVDERNLKFIEAAHSFLQEGDAVIAVGSFHLPGEMGLIELLRQHGYQVERVFVKGEAADP